MKSAAIIKGSIFCLIYSSFVLIPYEFFSCIFVKNLLKVLISPCGVLETGRRFCLMKFWEKYHFFSGIAMQRKKKNIAMA